MRKIIVTVLMIISYLVILGSALSFGEDKKGNNSQYDKKELSVYEYTKRFKVKFIMGEIDDSINLIDEMFDKYGYTTTGLYYKCLGVSAYFNATDDHKEKVKYLEELFTYSGTLTNFCKDSTINKKYLKDCDEFLYKIDSVKIKCREEIYGK